MKLAILVLAALAVQTSLVGSANAQTTSPCEIQAKQIAETALGEYLDTIPNSSSPEGITQVTGPVAQAPSPTGSTLLVYTAEAEYFTYVKYGYSYDVALKLQIALNGNCSLYKKSIKERTLNVEPPADEKDGIISCAKELGLVCSTGFVDRCQYPKAETHLCVPSVP